MTWSIIGHYRRPHTFVCQWQVSPSISCMHKILDATPEARRHSSCLLAWKTLRISHHPRPILKHSSSLLSPSSSGLLRRYAVLCICLECACLKRIQSCKSYRHCALLRPWISTLCVRKGLHRSPSDVYLADRAFD